MTPELQAEKGNTMTPELQAELDAVHARHAERERLLRVSPEVHKATAGFNAPITNEEIVAHVESLHSDMAAIRRDLNAVMSVMQSHFGRELVIAQASN